jgi:crotonobetainyl-CoA:carnitine CoA-transferase CaiB-like acyl-CoA transferase
MDDATEALCAVGIPAAPAVNAYLSGESAHLEARGYFQWVDHPVAGPVPYPSAPFRIDGEYLALGGAAPTLGQDNEKVLTSLLGLNAQAIIDLRDREIIGQTPVRGPG